VIPLVIVQQLTGCNKLAAVAAIVATRNDEMLRDLFKHMSEFDLSFFSNSTASQFLRHFLLKGTLQDIEVLQKRLRRLLGDLTFLEAFNLSGKQAVISELEMRYTMTG
jgi:TAG lipase/steryl ester hydrolase/phospholipase A2/LPA acyltransferase